MTKEAKTLYGPRKLGEKAFQAQQDQKVMTSPGGVVYGSRKGGPGAPGPFATLKEKLYDLKVGEAKALIQKVADPKELAALHALERSHPSYDAGRKGVMDAIEERQGELGIAAAGGEPNTDESDEDEPTAVDALRAQLEEDPDALDALIEAELAEGEPRAEALELFRETEQARDEPRDSVLELLDQAGE